MCRSRPKGYFPSLCYGEEQKLNGVREVGGHAVGDVEEFTAGADKSVLVYSFTYSFEPCPCAACVREADDQPSCSV